MGVINALGISVIAIAEIKKRCAAVVWLCYATPHNGVTAHPDGSSASDAHL